MVAFATDPSTHDRGSLEVAHDLFCIQLPIVNVAMVGPKGAPDRGWVLIDAGLYFSAGRIRSAARERFGAARPHAIILTHGHFDHIGALAHLAAEWDTPIYAHPLELPYLDGRCPYPPPDPFVGGGAMSLMARIYPRGPIDVSDQLQQLPKDHSVPGMHGWRWIHTPGHSPGHISLFREKDRALIVGDAFVTTNQESMVAALLQPQHVHRPPAYFTPDWQSAHRSVIELTMLDPDHALAGHGRPMHGETLRGQLQQLARGFARESVPRHGRYSAHPAIADENGVVSVPPPVVSTRTLLAGVAAVALAGIGLFALARSRPARKLAKSAAISAVLA